MVDILLTTFNAKYYHTAFGLRYLYANLGPLKSRATILEFSCNDLLLHVLDAVLEQRPRIVGIGVYIWNIDIATQFVMLLKRAAPDITVVLGGPEVSYESEALEISRHADHIVSGEGDLVFAELCERILRERHSTGGLPTVTPPAEVHYAPVPKLEDLQLPYDAYTDEDLKQRTLYVEASRGCPFTCEFCLSALEIPVRQFPLEAFLDAMQRMLDRGARQFKFIDRTFNLNMRVSRSILEFFLQRYDPGMFLHFEMVPDRLPESLREVIQQFPAGALQFEVGIQTFNEQVAERISRRQNNSKIDDNLRFLRQHTGVHLHVDLIVGLPGEDEASFARGFDRLVGLQPHEIQVGMLKRLRGTPIVRHDAEFKMVYSPIAPYELLSNSELPFAAMQRLRRFARYWDLISNSGNFLETTGLIWGDGSPFEGFMRWSDWLFARDGRTHGIALPKLMELLFRYLVDELQRPAEVVATTMYRDYVRGGRVDRPLFLRPYLEHLNLPAPRRAEKRLPQRQQRHHA